LGFIQSGFIRFLNKTQVPRQHHNRVLIDLFIVDLGEARKEEQLLSVSAPVQVKEVPIRMVVHGCHGLSNAREDGHQVVYHGYVVSCI